MTLGERIRELRKAGGLSQEQLAVKLDVTRQTISKWELDSTVPELEKLVSLGELFGVSMDQLIKGEASENRGPAEIDIGALARQNRYHRLAVIFLIIGAVSCQLALTLGVVLYTLNRVALDIEYILYRYIAVGEWAGITVDYHGPWKLVWLPAGIGILSLAGCLLVRWRYHSHPEGRAEK